MQMNKDSSHGVLRRLRDDLAGATLVQFVAILPVFVFIVYSAWAVFSVLIAHQTLCDAAYEAARYLQVEGPLLPEESIYPDDWIAIADKIAYDEVATNASLARAWREGGREVDIWPPEMRDSPKEPGVVDADYVRNNSLFHVRVTGTISNPLWIFFPGDPVPDEDDEDFVIPGLKLTCQSTGFFEGPPIKSTDEHSAGGTVCPFVPRCTSGPRATDCIPPGSCPTVTPGCPPCDP